MKTNKKFLKNMRSYTAKVMNCKDFFDYITVMFANYWGAHQEARTETLSFANESVMLREAYNITGDKSYLTKLFKSFKWFLGDNDLRISLYNHDTQGCCDGIESYGVNQNQGAESTIAYLVSYLNVLKAHEDYYRKEKRIQKQKKEDDNKTIFR